MDGGGERGGADEVTTRASRAATQQVRESESERGWGKSLPARCEPPEEFGCCIVRRGRGDGRARPVSLRRQLDRTARL